MQAGGTSDLRSRLAAAVADPSGHRPIAVLAGSGISAPAVPGTEAIIEIVRRSLGGDDLTDLDAQLETITDSGERYRKAFGFLSLRRPPALRDRIVRIAVLKAYGTRFQSTADLDEQHLAEYEADIDQWSLPDGLASLGRIWSGMPAALRGPIVTTNFDPLCEIALQRAGLSASSQVLDTDGAFLRDVQLSAQPQVVHLHGYWRYSTTLNLTEELDLARPALEGSIRTMLTRYTVLVLAYGGWRDALTRQLVGIVREQSARELDVLWCFRESQPEIDEMCSSEGVLKTLLEAPGNVKFYSDVDVNSFLPDLESSIAAHLVYPGGLRASKGEPNMLGWSSIQSANLKRRDDQADRASALAFFDGRLPNWEDAVSPLIPRRDIVTTLVNGVAARRRSRVSSLTLLLGPSGEGKTTALMQSAVAFAQLEHDSPVVLYCSDANHLSATQILALPANADYVLMVDDAFRAIDQLRALVTTIQTTGREGLHIVAASRDMDWSGAGGHTFQWKRYVPLSRRDVKGINRPDAIAIVRAWEEIGDKALGTLASLPSEEERVAQLQSAARDPEVSDDGALLGALLATRYGSDLVEHVRQLMDRLMNHRIVTLEGDAHASLLDAFVVVALPHANKIRVMTPPVLAQLMDVRAAEVFGSVLLPLASEAPTAFNGEVVTIRHRLIAREVCRLAPEFGIDLAAVARRIVAAAIAQIRVTGLSPELRVLAYMSQRLEDPELAVAAAEAGVEADPTRLSFRTSLSRALRRSGRLDDAARINEETVSMAPQMSDSRDATRVWLNEWGVVEGNRDRWASNAVLSALALQDGEQLGVLRADQLTLMLSCLALAIRRLWERTRSSAYLSGLAAVCEVSDDFPLDALQRRWIEEARSLAFTNGARVPSTAEACLEAVAAAAEAAREQLDAPLPAGLPPLRFRFTGLRRLMRE